MGDSGRENARFSFTGEIFVEEMRDFLDTWGIPVAKLFDFGVNGYFQMRKGEIFELNGGFSKRKCVMLGLNGGLLKRKRAIFGLNSNF